MTKKNIKNINETYHMLLDQQSFTADELDYSVLEQHKFNLKILAGISNSVISVFDTYKKEHAFYSSNLSAVLGYTQQHIEEGGDFFLDTKVHPDDFAMIMQNAISILKLFSRFSTEEKLNHKFVTEYRILNAANNYVRVIEQHQVLELANNGNVWLALSILDISPNQKNMNEGLKSELLNFSTGKIIPFTNPEEEISSTLSKREIEVLKLVKDGFLSKEISDKLAISLHTVNTHRQKVLAKLSVNNSMEAVALASKLELI
ncbi:LuxR C-terminal-related transcriptional regulator [Parafilimonas sp.]|uniref:LuxR C-terminal-related transcriptional regulator n=1 Tax=Parafilimonas sp. TaxID=1969739 RepID=UPI003F7FB074